MHLTLLLDEVVDLVLDQTSVLANNGAITLPLDFLNQLLLGLGILTLTNCNLLLLFNLLNAVGTLKVHDTVQIKSSLNLDDRKVARSGFLDALDSVLADPGVDTLWKRGGVGISSLELEGALSVESKDLS